jgi:hypothetical protein
MFLDAFSGKPWSSIRDSDRLQEDLRLDHAALVLLAQSLRGYITRHNPQMTQGVLGVTEIETSGFTALQLIDLTTTRIRQ